MWNCGVQMVALNYQTGDRPMQLNQGKFMQNGGCGYVLKPDFLTSNLEDRNSFDIYNKETLPKSVEPLALIINIIAARHLMKNGRGIVSPFVEIEIVGLEYDSVKLKTSTIRDNGFNPVWKECFTFEVFCPDLALLRFVVYNEDMFGDPNFIGQATYPLNMLLSCENLIYMWSFQGNEEAYAQTQELKNQARYLNRAIEEDMANGDALNVERHRLALRSVEQQLALKIKEKF
ncbi:1-phosphatidylinositol 4:5-bisphosphate phosphodiesterase gamma-1-like protein [Dinothrombium tinctorium]|uniref:1-phosphatidylinositol 4:5-bisphosphate phosphodiesterase gamma-1-like protein n=1 Tax=Dinothrombium tinctorium TaxID=1965070 RepID=A0A3S4RDD4_9ACAR|nr:1-phosphatidylinositol 4:5-bisphosphate phosphodiesterase gamma-1-like protein [Dinothrombium tinctorium]RWS14786.1 1-phosphatidylinositol 4:5-bisphosphate phosphodiesterase gamma-1-like protein [Dinothrombium tinctorium]